MGMRMNMVEKDMERQGNEKQVLSFLKTIVSFPLYCFAYDMFTELCCFFWLWCHVWNSRGFGIFSKIGLWRSKSVKGKITQLEIIIIQILFQFKLIFKKNHSQIMILFTTSATAINIFRIEALYLLYFAII